MSDRSDPNKMILQKIVYIFNTGDVSDADLLFSPNYLDHQKPSGMKIDGPDEFKQIVSDVRRSLRTLRVTIENLFAEEDKVAGKLRWYIFDFSGKAIDRETIEILRFEDGQVIEHWGADAWRTEKSV